MLYEIKDNERLFAVTKSYLHHEIDRGSRIANIKRIRILDLRQQKVNSKAKILLSFWMKNYLLSIFNFYKIFLKSIDFINKGIYFA